MPALKTADPTKGEVNRAGRLVAECLAALRGKDAVLLAELEQRDIGRAFELIDWWRGLHGR